MDARDFRILVDLMQDPTASYESLGRSVGLSGTAVSTRLDRMLEEGPLAGFVGLPRAVLFDRAADVLWTPPLADVQDRLDVALGVDPVVWVSHLHTGEVAVMVYAKPGTSLPLRELEEVLGAPLTSAGGYATWTGNPEDAQLSALDWRVLRHLVRAPRLSVTDLADRTALSRNTVRKRRDALYARRLVTLFPLLETARAPGLMLYNLVVDVTNPGDLNAVQGVLPNAVLLVRHAHEGTHGATFLGHADTLAATTLALEEAKRLPGVRRARLVVDLTRLFAVDRVEAWVDEHVAAAASRE